MARKLTRRPIRRSRVRGVTLIELLIYMAIFSTLVVGFLAATFYLQRVIQSQAYIYMSKECVYQQLDLLQQHMRLATAVEVATGVTLFSPQDKIFLGLNPSGNIEFRYDRPGRGQKTIQQCGTTAFLHLSATRDSDPTTLTSATGLNVSIGFVDPRGRRHAITERLVAPRPVIY